MQGDAIREAVEAVRERHRRVQPASPFEWSARAFAVPADGEANSGYELAYGLARELMEDGWLAEWIIPDDATEDPVAAMMENVSSAMLLLGVELGRELHRREGHNAKEAACETSGQRSVASIPPTEAIC